MLFYKTTPELGSNIKAHTVKQVISYASRTLPAAESNFAYQMEALAIILASRITTSTSWVGTLFCTKTTNFLCVSSTRSKQPRAPQQLEFNNVLYFWPITTTLSNTIKGVKLKRGCFDASSTSDNALDAWTNRLYSNTSGRRYQFYDRLYSNSTCHNQWFASVSSSWFSESRMAEPLSIRRSQTFLPQVDAAYMRRSCSFMGSSNCNTYKNLQLCY